MNGRRGGVNCPPVAEEHLYYWLQPEVSYRAEQMDSETGLQVRPVAEHIHCKFNHQHFSNQTRGLLTFSWDNHIRQFSQWTLLTTFYFTTIKV